MSERMTDDRLAEIERWFNSDLENSYTMDSFPGELLQDLKAERMEFRTREKELLTECNKWIDNYRDAEGRIVELESRLRDKDNRITHLEEYAAEGPYDEWQVKRNSKLTAQIEAVKALPDKWIADNLRGGVHTLTVAQCANMLKSALEQK